MGSGLSTEALPASMDRQTALDLVGGEWWDESKWVELQEDGKVTTQLDETAFTNLRWFGRCAGITRGPDTGGGRRACTGAAADEGTVRTRGRPVTRVSNGGQWAGVCNANRVSLWVVSACALTARQAGMLL